MATIFLSYRRTDGPQACRVYDWLGQRFGYDVVFMDVAAIPFAVNFPDFIRQAIANSSVMITLIGEKWLSKIHEADDPVRMELEAAVTNHIPVLPVLIGNTPMPDPEKLPKSIATIALQNAVTVGVLQDFNTHMQLLLPKIESILGTLAPQNVVSADPYVIERACNGTIRYLRDTFDLTDWVDNVEWRVIGTHDFVDLMNENCVTLLLHRVVRMAESVDLHFMLSFWTFAASLEHVLAGWVISQLERTPIIPDEYFSPDEVTSELILKIRRSDEDARQVWKMVTDDPLRLSLTYVATISPKIED